LGKPTDEFMDVCRRWADDVGLPAYSAADWGLAFLGGSYEGRGKNPDLADLSPRERAERPMREHEGHPTLDQFRDRIDRLVNLGVMEEWLIASLVAAIADSLDHLADAAEIQAKRARLTTDLQALKDDPDRRTEFIEASRARQSQDGFEETDEEAAAGFERWISHSVDMLQPLTMEEWMDRTWKARRWREVTDPLTGVSKLLERTSPLSRR
jgi:hypothetical protein